MCVTKRLLGLALDVVGHGFTYLLGPVKRLEVLAPSLRPAPPPPTIGSGLMVCGSGLMVCKAGGTEVHSPILRQWSIAEEACRRQPCLFLLRYPLGEFSQAPWTVVSKVAFL